MTLHLCAAALRPSTFDPEARTIEAIVSTGASVARAGYTEVLDLRGADLSRFIGAPVLDGHRRDTTRDQLGVIDAARMTPDGLLVTIRFRESTGAAQVMQDVASGTLRGLSIGYSIEQTREVKDGTKRRRTTIRWTPIEVSIVPVPADPGAHFRTGANPMPTPEDDVQVLTRAKANAQIRSIAELAGIERAWTDARIDAEDMPDTARELAFAAMAQRQASTRTRTTAQVTFDHNDPAVFATRAGEALFARMHPDREIGAPARQFAGMRLPDLPRESARRHGIAVEGLSDAQVFTRAGTMVTGDLAGILGDSAGRSLRVAYDQAPSGLRPSARAAAAPGAGRRGIPDGQRVRTAEHECPVDLRVDHPLHPADADQRRSGRAGRLQPPHGHRRARIREYASTTPQGTLAWLIEQYLASPKYRNLSDSRKRSIRGELDWLRGVAGDLPFAKFGTRHVEALMGKKTGPTAANTVKKNLSMLFNFAIKREMGVTFNPARFADRRKENADGYHTWTDQEIVRFKDQHPTGSKARLAMMLFLWTGASRQDVAAMGWRNVQGDRITYRRGKTGIGADLPIHEELALELADVPRDQFLFVTHGKGLAYKPSTLGNWFKDQCRAAGNPLCSAHGLRKSLATLMANAGK